MHGQSPASPEGGRYLSRVGGGVVALGQTGERHPWISFFVELLHVGHRSKRIDADEQLHRLGDVDRNVPSSAHCASAGLPTIRGRPVTRPLTWRKKRYMGQQLAKLQPFRRWIANRNDVITANGLDQLMDNSQMPTLEAMKSFLMLICACSLEMSKKRFRLFAAGTRSRR